MQPRYKRFPPLLPRFKVLRKLQGPCSALPTGQELSGPISLNDKLQVTPKVPLLPAGSRVLGSWPVAEGETGPSKSLGVPIHNAPPPSFDPCKPKGGSCASALSLRFSPSPCDNGDQALAADLGSSPLVCWSSPSPPSLDDCDINLCIGDCKDPKVMDVNRLVRNPVTKFRDCLEGTRANYYVLGAFVSLERKGVATLTRRFPCVAAFYVRCEALVATSIAMSHTEFASPHCDYNSPGALNVTIGLGDYKGGEFWGSSEQGTVPIPCQGERSGSPEYGVLVDTRLRPFAFDGTTKHATTSWVGDRWVPTFYVVNRIESLRESSLQSLMKLGFPMPDLRETLKQQAPASNESTKETIIGVAWDAMLFVAEAAKRGHPKHMLRGLPDRLCTAIRGANRLKERDLCWQRTAELRKWFARAKDFKEDEEKMHEDMPGHLKSVLKLKHLSVRCWWHRATKTPVRTMKLQRVFPFRVRSLPKQFQAMLRACDAFCQGVEGRCKGC